MFSRSCGNRLDIVAMLRGILILHFPTIRKNPVLTTKVVADTGCVAVHMFSRWSQENCKCSVSPFVVRP
jgi:hypothetical protein